MGAILSVDRKIVESAAPSASPDGMIRRILLPAVLPAYVVACGWALGWAGCSWSPQSSWAHPRTRISAARRPAARQARADSGGDRDLRHSRQDTDWLIELGAAPLLRWQDAFGRQGGAA